jgi:hypothetical protein
MQKVINYPDSQLDFKGFVLMGYERSQTEKFNIGVDHHGRMILPIEYPLRRRVNFTLLSNASYEEQRDFRKTGMISTNLWFPPDSYQKMAEDELRDLDDRHPGWSMGIWD